jgi:hypothetical protein
MSRKSVFKPPIFRFGATSPFEPIETRIARARVGRDDLAVDRIDFDGLRAIIRVGALMIGWASGRRARHP